MLDEAVHFLEGRALGADEESYYDLPGRSGESASLYEHCARAIRHGLRFGEHGLPLMGSGDWNDGMNLVGIHGKGESVWLGFFLHEVLTSFAELARAPRRPAFAERVPREAQRPAPQPRQARLGRRLVSARLVRRRLAARLRASNAECSIDSIAQSWSVLSGAGDLRALADGDGRARPAPGAARLTA